MFSKKNQTFLKSMLFFAFTLSYGCSTLQQWGGIRAPELSVQKVNIANAGLEGMDLIMNIDVKNHYPIGISLPAFDYNFLINDHVFLKGENALNQSLSALSNNQVQVPVHINFMDLYQSLSALTNEDQAGYQLNGNIHFDVPILGRLQIPFEKKGQLPLLKMPKISVKGLRVDSLNFTAAKLSLDIEMDNPNAFMMLLQNFSYKFSVDGLQWADGNLEKNINFDKHGKSNVSIPIALNFFEMGQTVFNVLKKRGSFPYEFDTQIKFKTDLPFLENVDIPLKKNGSIQLTR
ncbi:secreted protein containing Water Stress and Hypersensitive response domain protein [Candidatus Magnetomorum sp. HK-1]|nr:secreted protein containing Water Stress and Hypersensitive response domain protein [Candidatus Magnetomorum sp. HK-1]